MDRRQLGSRLGARRVAHAPRRLGVGVPVVARGVVRKGSARLGRHDRPRGDRRRRSGRPTGWRRDGSRRAHDPRSRPRLAPPHAAPPDPHRRAHVVSALQRARQRVRSRRPHDEGRARRRRVGDQRPEGVEHLRPSRRVRHAPGPHRLGCAEAQGHQLLRAAHAPARCRGATAAADESSRVVQRGVPHGRPGSGRHDGW